MVWLRWFLLGLLLGVGVVAGWWRLDHAPKGIAADFVSQFATATVRRPAPDVFTVREVTIAGVTKPSIAVQQPSRIAWDLKMPAHAWVEVDLGLQEQAWTLAGDGVLFRVGISLDGRYEELVTKVVNPFDRAGDRGWVPVAVDLSQYAGRDVSLIFNTGPGLEGDNRANDLGVWGAPRVVTR